MNANYIVRRALRLTLKENNNYMLSIVGDTGSGKSYSSLSLAMLMDPEFSMDRVCFRASKFLEVVNSDLDPGSVIMFDEAGVDVSSRDWYSTKNKLIVDTVDVFRRDNLICLWTTPSLKGLDSQVRSKFDGVMLMVQRRRGQYKKVVTDHIEGKVYYKYPSARGAKIEGQTERGIFWNVVIPNTFDVAESKGKDGITDKYEEEKKEFTNIIKSEALENLLDSEETKKTLTTRGLIGMFAHESKYFEIDSKMSDTDLQRYISSKLAVEYPSTDFKKKEVREAIVYVRNEGPKKVKQAVDHPFEEEKSQTDVYREYLPIVHKLKKGEDGMSLMGICRKLNVDYQKMYRVYRKFQEYIDGSKSDEFNIWYDNVTDEELTV